ncbi:PhzF family phenazine biosynthesis protein [Selenomonas ruminantium]|uniref:PhzF family phenazine biosynthesis protein n=1 Tax=Selenomonas ruminantium TaxID=971 RepID=UPI000942AB41|nr:PhzF family phenazine biosynthesis protein [Selenomonas ruminantium]
MITILFANPERGIKWYFTPTTEVPICGHAAIEEQLSTSCWVQKTKAGILPIDIEKDEIGDYGSICAQNSDFWTGCDCLCYRD